ncbi:TLC domain-containing protein [Gorgonomyces haynaldii]|nr:TLC domain-containing protein [Gorgonomyces haynaldii]
MDALADLIAHPVQSISSFFKLTKLSAHGPTIVLSAVSFQLLYIISMHFSKGISYFDKLSKEKQISWGMHLVSAIHAPLVSILAVPIFNETALFEDRMHGYSYYASQVYAIACGYFFWDMNMVLYNWSDSGLGFIFHGVSCFFVFLLSFKPIFNYLGAVVLLFEVSTIFLNIHWFCDKIGLTGSTFQWINGIFLLSSFFFFRCILGAYTIADWIYYVVKTNQVTKTFMFFSFAGSSLTLLNFFWFSRMIASVMSRFKDNTKKDDNFGRLKQ